MSKLRPNPPCKSDFYVIRLEQVLNFELTAIPIVLFVILFQSKVDKPSLTYLTHLEGQNQGK